MFGLMKKKKKPTEQTYKLLGAVIFYMKSGREYTVDVYEPETVDNYFNALQREVREAKPGEFIRLGNRRTLDIIGSDVEGMKKIMSPRTGVPRYST